MNYKLFDDFITLQAILKELGIIQSGGAIKAFLQEKKSPPVRRGVHQRYFFMVSA